MSDYGDYVSTSPEVPRELLVSVHLYISAAMEITLRKPVAVRKKSDLKRDSTGGEDNKFKEKTNSNWTSFQKGLNGAGHWRSATCKLREEGERSLLNVYVDESILYQTVYIHLLNQTDIRQVDTSLFYRKDCIGIFCIAGQRWTSSHTAEPLYLQFPSAEACSTWQALLKSCAIPEIYGRWLFPTEGGSYRMWRQVELTVVQGKNLGLTRYGGNTNDGNSGDTNLEVDGLDVDLSCEIHLNDILCSRTTVKKGLGSPDWHENFTFPGLPPFESLDIIVWREKKLSKPSVLGITNIALSNFRRGDVVEGWFPVLNGGAIGAEIQVGELRLKICVDEEIILPYAAYEGLMEMCKSRNFLDWMSDLENSLKLKSISPHLMSIAIANDVVIEHVQDYAAREITNTSTSQQTLFRGNTTLTKVVELCMTWFGKPFLEASIGNVLRRLCAEKTAIEVDPIRNGKGTKDVERNVEHLIYWCQEFWNQIYSVRAACPNELRIVFKTIRKLVEQRYRNDLAITELNNKLRWQSVSAFCFLRFIVPAILHPHLFGLCSGLPSPPVQRSLTLIAKVIQSLANLNTGEQKETFMRGVQDFLRDSIPAMIEYISVVSSPVGDTPLSNLAYDANRLDRLDVVNALRQRSQRMTVLDKESIPVLPHLLDIPKHLAIITSAIIRSSKNYSTRPKASDDGRDLAVEEFCSMCLEVEEEALRRVSQLATKLAESRRPSLLEVPANGSVMEEETLCLPLLAGHQPSRRRKLFRPSTAPSPSDPNSLIRRQMFFGDNSPSLHSYAQITSNDHPVAWGQRHARAHMKAPSTDSMPSLITRDFPLSTPSCVSELPIDSTDDPGKRKKGLLRGILRR